MSMMDYGFPNCFVGVAYIWWGVPQCWNRERADTGSSPAKRESRALIISTMKKESRQRE